MGLIVKVSLAEDTSEDTVLLLPGKKFKKMFADGEVRNKLKLSERVAYGFGHIMNDICAAMWFSYTLLFLKVVLEMPSIIAGTMIFLGQLADAIGSPIIGILVDRYGTRKFWHMTGTSLIAFSFSLIFSKCPWGPDSSSSSSVNGTDIAIKNLWDESSSTLNIITSLYYAVFVTIFQVGWAMVQIAHLAIIPEMTPDKCARADLTAIRYTATVCSSVFVYIVTWFILHFTGGNKDNFGPDDFFKFKDVVLICLLTGGTFTMLFHALVKTENESKVISSMPKSATVRLSILKDYFKSFQLYQITFIYFCSRMLLSINLLYMPLYLENNDYDSEFLALVPLTSYVASFLGSLIIGKIRILCNSKVNYFLGAVISIAGSVWIGIGLMNFGELLGVSALLGVGSSITGVASLCLCADLIGLDTENGAFVYSIVTAVDKLLEGVAVILIEKYKDHDESSHYYKDVLTYGCVICSVSGLIILLTMCFNTNQTSEKDSTKETVTE